MVALSHAHALDGPQESMSTQLLFLVPASPGDSTSLAAPRLDQPDGPHLPPPPLQPPLHTSFLHDDPDTTPSRTDRSYNDEQSRRTRLSSAEERAHTEGHCAVRHHSCESIPTPPSYLIAAMYTNAFLSYEFFFVETFVWPTSHRDHPFSSPLSGAAPLASPFIRSASPSRADHSLALLSPFSLSHPSLPLLPSPRCRRLVRLDDSCPPPIDAMHSTRFARALAPVASLRTAAAAISRTALAPTVAIPIRHASSK